MTKKTLAIILASFVVMLQLAMLSVKIARANASRYWVEAYCEQENNELIFTFSNHSFVWELGANDKTPSNHYAVLLMDNNNTEGYLEDDIIISYK